MLGRLLNIDPREKVSLVVKAAVQISARKGFPGTTRVHYSGTLLN
jgi:hypothetical protein